VKSTLTLIALLLPGLAAAGPPSVASINLCTDQLVLSIAAREQILSLSWLGAHPEESMLADEAAGYPQNFGSAEELIRIGADVIVAGTETSPFTRQLLRRLGATVVEVSPAQSLADVARNLEQVGAAIERQAAAAAAIASMDARIRALRSKRRASPQPAIVIRPGGFTIGRKTLAFELLELAGLENSIAELDRWGSLEMETLLRQRPAYLVVTSYRSGQASLANSIFAHPALGSIASAPETLSVEARYFACGAPASLTSAESLVEQMAVN
jgi:iron complex transport system substrate-binding protein